MPRSRPTGGRKANAQGRFVLGHERRLQSGPNSSSSRSRNDILEGRSFARKLRLVDATEVSTSQANRLIFGSSLFGQNIAADVPCRHAEEVERAGGQEPDRMRLTIEACVLARVNA
jgi:hypothetical protein